MIMIDREAVLLNILILLILYMLIQGFGSLFHNLQSEFKSSPCLTQNIDLGMCSK